MIMRELASIELRVLAKELSGFVVGSFLKKFYDLGNDSFLFVFTKDRQDHIVYCRLLATINETAYREQAEAATPFAIGVRNRIEGRKVVSLEQHGTDRVLVIKLAGKEGERSVIIEMFGKGNLVIVNGDGVIETVYRVVRQKDREIVPKAKYAFPASEGIDFENPGKQALQELVERLAKSDARLISELVRQVNAGPLYLENAIVGAGMNPKMPANEAAAGKDALIDAISALGPAVTKPMPALYMRGDERVDFAITPISKYKDMKSVRYDTLGKLLDDMYLAERSKAKESTKARRAEEMTVNIERQRTIARRQAEESEKYAKAAKLIQAHMSSINEIVRVAREKKRATVEELNGMFSGIMVKHIDLKNKRITIEIVE